MIYVKGMISKIETAILEYKKDLKASNEDLFKNIKKIVAETELQNYPDVDGPIVPGMTYRCWKGGLYYVDAIGYHTETGEKLVCYHALYSDCKSYVRPYNMFASRVPEGREADNITNQDYRFEIYTISPGQKERN